MLGEGERGDFSFCCNSFTDEWTIFQAQLLLFLYLLEWFVPRSGVTLKSDEASSYHSLNIKDIENYVKNLYINSDK